MPFAESSIPSIQLCLLETFLKKQDIDVSSRHLYLFAADFYDLNNYAYLINAPNDSYTTQMVFSKYVFPDHWKKNFQQFKKYYDDVIAYDTKFSEDFSFEAYVEKTDQYLNWVLKNISWKDFDIIGFTLNYGQFLPSLAVAKKLKEIFPDKKIVFGGSTTVDILGKKILESFDFIDFIVSGDGEEPLRLLATDYDNYQKIPGLIFRKNAKVFFNKNNCLFDINSLPFLSFDSYYQQLGMASSDTQQYFQLNGRLPVEFSRGCWWNKCTFCNMGLYQKCYREKDIDRFVNELDFLSDKYKMLCYQVIGSTLAKNDVRLLCEKIIDLDKDFSFIAEARADQLKSKDYSLLKKTGFDIIQTGIETFSQNYIKKMNKGVGVIDNVAALKFCKENSISNEYNFIINYPNEEKTDFEETKKNISVFKHFLDPPRISRFVVGYGSIIYDNLKKFNIKHLNYKKTDKIMFPQSFLEKNFCFFYSYDKKEKFEGNNWEKLIQNWKKEREQLELQGVKTKKIIDKYVFYFVDGGSYIKIYDKRNKGDVGIFILNEVERNIFLSCMDVITYDELRKKLSYISESELKKVLQEFEENGILFRENNRFLSLPLNIKKNSVSVLDKKKQVVLLAE